MTSSLASELAQLPSDVSDRLDAFGFDRAWFLTQADRYAAEGAGENRVRGEVTPPAPEDVVDLPEPGTPEWLRAEEAGAAALANGECALVVLAGGMATRMGGVVKALVEAVPGRTFLDLRLQAQEVLEERVGHIVPMWLMTSHATDGPIRDALGERLDGFRIATFPQRVSLRLSPDGSLFREEDGRPSEHAPGHGDLPEALQRSDLLDRFLDEGGRYVTVANLDNLGATLDPAVIGVHIGDGAPVTCEVVDKHGGDKGGIPVRLDGRPLVLEEFRIPESFDPATVRVFNTNTFHFDAAALRDLDFDWTYFVVEKDVEGRPAIQFERLINEVASHLETRFVRVPREGAQSRFLPIKDHDDLEEKRPTLESIATSRGMLE